MPRLAADDGGGRDQLGEVPHGREDSRPHPVQRGGLRGALLALSGTAWANHEAIFSNDIVNGEVRNDDLAANSVGSAKIVDRSVKNADLSIGASSSNTIADGGIQGIDVKNGTLTGDDVAGDSLTAGEISEIGTVDFISAGGAPAFGVSPEVELLTVGPFTIKGRCTNTGGSPDVLTSKVVITSSTNDWAMDSNGPSGDSDQTGLAAGEEVTLASLGPTDVPHYQSGDYSALSDSDIFVPEIIGISGEVTVGTNPVETAGTIDQPCYFLVTALRGP